MGEKIMAEKVVITVQEYDARDEPIGKMEFIVFDDAHILREIHEIPAEAVALSLQIAINMVRYADDSGRFMVQSRKGKWEFDVNQWRARK